MRFIVFLAVTCVVLVVLVLSDSVKQKVTHIRSALAARGLQATDACQPFPTDDQTTCEQAACPNLKWVDAKCGRGRKWKGCKDARFCGYSCKAACRRDKLCRWNPRTRHCRPVPDPFNLTLVFAGSTPFTDEQRSVIERAAKSWTRTLRHGLATNVTIRAGERYCNMNITQDYMIQDLLVFVLMQPIDGLERIYAQAGVCGLDNAKYARLGILRLDEVDFPNLIRTGEAYGLVQHELGHAFGIGSLWDRFGFITKGGIWPIRYVRKHGIAGNRIVKGPKDGPYVEDEFGPTTSRSHWKEFVYGNELMTGVYDAKTVKMSAMSLGALKDLGYDVDMSRADKFTVPRSRTGSKGTKTSGDKSFDDGLLSVGEDSLGPDHEIKIISEEDEK